MTTTDLFPRETAGLPLVNRPIVHRLHDGDRLALEIAPVAAVIGRSAVRMIGYNGSIPGPTLHVDQGSEIVVDVTNSGDVDTTVHWHGVRLDNRYDGVPVDTQAPIAVGGEFTYRVKFPDAGFYWYHPHLREDYGQEMGMYGTIIVEPSDPDLLAGRRPSDWRSRSTTSSSRMAPSPRSVGPGRPSPPWVGSGTCCSSTAKSSSSRASTSARSSDCTSSIPPTHGSSTSPIPARAAQARGRRQRPLSARDVRRGGPSRALRASHRRRPVRPRRARSVRAPDA